ncbi:hypothetical protein [Brevibacillus migulae]|uniref:hypothetical protein n=1 Tax=Brevibacillus migulae TaxID=1644114 RepID=UPI00106E2744|nr:hypothetical protein [Brevibacillus migulae]
MKRSYRGVLLLCLVLFLNLLFTQYTVNLFFAQRYELTIVLAAANLLTFPLAWFIYRKEKRAGQ